MPSVAPAGAHLGAAEQAQREHFEVRVRAVARDRHRPPRVPGALLGVLRMAGALDRHPAVARPTAQPSSTRSARDSQPRAAEDLPEDQVLVRDPDRDPGGLVAATGTRVLLERPLARGDALLDAAEEPQRLAEAIARVGRLRLGQRLLEATPRRIPPRVLQRRGPGLERRP